MGVGYTSDYFSGLLGNGHKKSKKRRQMQTVELKVRMDCCFYFCTVLAQSTGNKSEVWPYVPYNLVMNPYTAQAYDKKAPPGYVRKIGNTTATTTMNYQDDHYIAMFSDDNPILAVSCELQTKKVYVIPN
ncbi:hypothetical protein MKX03_009635 [Papaver bracteatum]|nr:hypothetical protein MKX03_009635 [Papaver bracteatum]